MAPPVITTPVSNTTPITVTKHLVSSGPPHSYPPLLELRRELPSKRFKNQSMQLTFQNGYVIKLLKGLRCTLTTISNGYQSCRLIHRRFKVNIKAGEKGHDTGPYATRGYRPSSR
jgi:hypothetical protein